MAELESADRVRPPLLELTLARVRELIREPEAVFWVFVFPILLAGILGLAFRSRPPEAIPVGVVDGSGYCLLGERSWRIHLHFHNDGSVYRFEFHFDPV